MPPLLTFVTAALYLFSQLASAFDSNWTLATPGTIDNLVITADNTLNSTTIRNVVGGRPLLWPPEWNQTLLGNPGMGIRFNNNANAIAYCCVAAKDGTGSYMMLQPNGAWYYPQASPGAGNVPIDPTTITIQLPDSGGYTVVKPNGYVSSARLYCAAGTELSFYFNADSGGVGQLIQPSATDGNDPSAAVLWGFVEFTNDSNGLSLNPTQVDFAGLPLALGVRDGNGHTHRSFGVKANSLQNICDALNSQTATDGQPWNKLCIGDNSGKVFRVYSPKTYIAGTPTAFQGYWEGYAAEVWNHYTTEQLSVPSAGEGTLCQVAGGLLTCTNLDGTFPSPTTIDIFTCALGPFTNTLDPARQRLVAVLCAAFVRSTLLLKNGNIQPKLPIRDYFSVDPTDYYSKWVHHYTWADKAYTFAYDDVFAPGKHGTSGALNVASPQQMQVGVGGK